MKTQSREKVIMDFHLEKRVFTYGRERISKNLRKMEMKRMNTLFNEKNDYIKESSNRNCFSENKLTSKENEKLFF